MTDILAVSLSRCRLGVFWFWFYLLLSYTWEQQCGSSPLRNKLTWAFFATARLLFFRFLLQHGNVGYNKLKMYFFRNILSTFKNFSTLGQQFFRPLAETELWVTVIVVLYHRKHCTCLAVQIQLKAWLFLV